MFQAFNVLRYEIGQRYHAHYDAFNPAEYGPLVEIVSKTAIKPSSPTPRSLSHYILSSYDQVIPSFYTSAAFFYSNPCCESSKLRQQLQNSLSKTLVSYYPFAGRLVGNDHIHCNDEGVEFVEVRIHRPIHDIVKHGKSHAKDLVLPREIPCNDDSLAVVQLSHFDCGGVAIAFGISHKVADACTLAAFMKDWAASTCLSSHAPSPLLVADSVFPHQDDVFCEPYVPAQNCVTRRFIFPATDIEKLKLKAVESGIQKPTRVDVVTALLYKSAMVATRSANCGSSRPSVLLQPMNIRPLIKLPQNAIGNIFSFNFCVNEDERMDFSALVGQLRKAKLKSKDLSEDELRYESQMQELELCLKQHNISSFDAYRCSSWCGFPFYDVDFGWRKPIWVCTFEPQIKDIFVLIDSPGGGIEAVVVLEKEKMYAFEKNEQLLAFASIDSARIEIEALVIS